MCGEVVNEGVRAVRCSDDDHAQRRKNGALFCTGCQGRLRTP
jgi:hypothetical protein